MQFYVILIQLTPPKIAYDKDEYAEPLINRVKESVGSHDGNQEVSITFLQGEEELQRQFSKICLNMGQIFDFISHCTE